MHSLLARGRSPIEGSTREETSPAARRIWNLGSALLFVVALLLRLEIVAEVKHPGHGDAAFYYTTALNFAERGRLEIDYVWHYLDPPEQLTHPAGDYWATFASVLMAAPIAAGAGLKGATALAALFGLLAGGATLYAARALGASRFIQLVACAIVLLNPSLFNASTSTDATIFYVAFVTGTFTFIARGAGHPEAYGWAALCAALAVATRQDGLLLAPALALAIRLSPHAPLERRSAYLRAACVYFLCLLPLWGARCLELGSPFPPSLSGTLFAREYEDIYSINAPRDWASYREWGWGSILESKRAALESNLMTFVRILGPTFLLALGLGLLRLLQRDRKARSAVLAFLGYLVLQVVFYGVVVSVVTMHGSFRRVVLATLPFLVVTGLNGLDRFLPWPGANALLLLGLCLPQLSRTTVLAQRKATFNGQLAQHSEQLHVALEGSLLPGDPAPVLMTRAPWELHVTRGYRAVQIPNDDLVTILAIADRYEVSHIVLPAPRVALTVDAAERHPRLQCVATVPGTAIRVYRLLKRTDP